MSRPPTAHVVMRGPTLFCDGCRASYLVTLPCPVDVFVATSQAFVRLHAGCAAPAWEAGS